MSNTPDFVKARLRDYESMCTVNSVQRHFCYDRGSCICEGEVRDEAIACIEALEAHNAQLFKLTKDLEDQARKLEQALNEANGKIFHLKRAAAMASKRG